MNKNFNYRVILGLAIFCIFFILYKTGSNFSSDTNFSYAPIQESGRMKSIDSFAKNQLLRFYGKREIKLDWHSRRQMFLSGNCISACPRANYSLQQTLKKAHPYPYRRPNRNICVGPSHRCAYELPAWKCAHARDIGAKRMFAWRHS